MIDALLQKAGLADIAAKVGAGQRLNHAEGVRLYRHPDLLLVGHLANLVRERKNGDRAYFIYNQHLNYSNICTNLCKFCAFGKEKGAKQAYEMDIGQIRQKIRERLAEPISEVHVVGGIHPDLPYSYYLDMLRAIKEERPEIHVQAFTCVEIAHLAELSGQSVEATLRELMAAGLDSLPGGGAEVFSPRIRALTCEKKLSGEGWLEVARVAHSLGLRSNATMLYGHIETIEERVEHLLRLRQAQDETGGFLTFIPLAFHPRNTKLSQLSRTSGVEDLKNIAVARLLLDNFDHIKAYWVMIGPKLAQVALAFGADDLDGTVKEELITSMAGGEAEQAMADTELIRLIREAGRVPVQRDTLYQQLVER
ncbi:MAG TPA: aminofutalosine synthase MqnE [Desulfurivibrio alkaliphilus]|uniref:Aminodeoxyfutalosine synthase n=1 Tax=Desulfurivibrio alkaliphilus TaxID=427923 RepID=A0A7C2THT8_9BACT|nr:aminofutalosine synthase MqnE [Desulfurivibrio alkaliphilus]